ncbi:hypothetical protein T310_5649, partial [Rasamsonia emersonii CBS 393.64]
MATIHNTINYLVPFTHTPFTYAQVNYDAYCPIIIEESFRPRKSGNREIDSTRILLTEMLAVPARRPASSISLRYRVHRTVQRRSKSTEAHTKADSGGLSEKPAAGDHNGPDVSSTPPPPPPPPPPAGSVASPAGAAGAPLTTNRSVWEM